MTTYDAAILSKREIGSGCETTAYHAWLKPNEASIFTSNKHKWDWLKFLGLTTSKRRKVYVKYAAAAWRNEHIRAEWHFNAVKMLKIEYDDPDFKAVWAEVRRFDYIIRNNDINEFDILRPIIEFCDIHLIPEALTDGNYFNFLRHPATGRIYPYDYYVPPHKLIR